MGADCAAAPVPSRTIKLIFVPNINRLAIIRQVVYMALTSCKVDMPSVGSTCCQELLKRHGIRIDAGDNATLGLSKPYTLRIVTSIVIITYLSCKIKDNSHNQPGCRALR